MTKTDDAFWRKFGVLLILITLFGFGMYFAANAIGGRAYAKMNSDRRGRGTDSAGRQITHRRPRRADAAAGAGRIDCPGRECRTDTAPESTTVGAASDTSAASSAGQTVAAGAVDLAAGEKIYQSACFACHLSGAAGAPKIDDPARGSHGCRPGHGRTPPVRHPTEKG